MVDSIKITALQDIGANIAYTTLVPLVNMAGTPTTQKSNLQNLGNLILNGAGGSYFARAAQANIALSVANAAQPNITSVGTLSSLAVLGNITAGNINGGNIVVANFYYGDGRFLTNVVANSSYSNSNVVSLMAAFGSNTIITTGNVSGGNILTSAQVIANGVIESGTGFSTGGYLSVDGNTDLHNTIVTGNLAATGNITATNLGNISTINLSGSNSDVLYGNGVFAAAAGGANTGNVTFDDATVQGVNYLNLSAGPDFTANLAYLQVRAGDVASHIHFDTGDSSAYDLIIGNDQKFVQVSSTGNILMSSFDGATAYEWNMDNTGNLNLPTNGNINVNGGGITQTINENFNIFVQDEDDDGWSLRNTITDGLGNNLARTELDRSSFTIETDMLGADYRWQFDGNTLQVSNDSTIRGFASNVTIQSMVSGGGGTTSLQSVSNQNDPNIFTTIDATTSGANISVYNGGSNGGVGYTWSFDNNGNLAVPGNINSSGDPSAAPSLNDFFGITSAADFSIIADSGNTSRTWEFAADGTTYLAKNQGSPVSYLATPINDANTSLNLQGGNGVTITSDPWNGSTKYWTFGTDGNLTLPTSGQIIVSGGLISSGASPAPTINGFSITNSVGISGTGNIAGNNISATGNISGNTNGFAIGYLNIPQVAASNATLGLTDAGKHYYSTSAGDFTLTVPLNSSVAFATGTAISIVVQSAGNVLVNAASGVTLYMAGNSTAANRVVSNYGMATLLKVATDTWMINGTGVA